MQKIEKMSSIAEGLVGCPYVFATSGKTCTPSMRRERANAKPDYAANIEKYCPVLSNKQSTCDGCKYDGKPAFDCRGLTYYACKNAGLTISSVGATTQWNADSWQEKGEIDKMPPDKPCILFRQDQSNAKVMQHTGVYLGDGYAVDSRSHASGTVKNKIDSFPWTHYAIPYGAFDEVDVSDHNDPETEPIPDPTENRATIRKGDKGDNVKQAQNMLLALGYNLPKYGADGSFGNETDTAVRAFQRDEGLDVDGVIGAKTWAALDKAINSPEDEEQTDPPATFTVIIRGVDTATAMYLLEIYTGATAEETNG